MKTQALTLKNLNKPIFAYFFAIIAALAILLQSLTYIHTLEANLDEGAYLLKGYLFATGRYELYQFYGPWSNHMPLAFLIPGYVQKLFSPGLETGRYFMVTVLAMTTLGLWITARRLSGSWWGAIVIGLLALNPGLIKIYSTATTQGLVACLLVWTLVFSLGENRPLWQIITGSFIAALLGLTRINMLAVLPFLLVYLFWQNGLRSALFAAFTGVATLLLGHALYWPNILIIWAKWLPKQLDPYLSTFLKTEGSTKALKPSPSTLDQLYSLSRTIQFHFIVIIGSLSSWLLWPKRSNWKRSSNFRAFVFLSGLFLTLLLMHAWASLGKNYCNYCLEGYLGFFAPLGLLVISTSFSIWQKHPKIIPQIIIVLLVISVCIGLGFAHFEQDINGILSIQVPRALFDLPRLTTGVVRLSDALMNKFSLSQATIRRLDPVVTGAIIGFSVMLAAWLAKTIWRQLAQKQPATHIYSYGYLLTLIFLGTGLLFSPTRLLGGGSYVYDCSGDALQTYPTAGEQLASIIPSGSQVFWRSSCPVPLLYLPGISIYPPQINANFAYFLGGDPDELLRLGYWNRELEQQWLQEADFIIIEAAQFHTWLREYIQQGDFKKILETPPLATCNPTTRLLVFIRKP
jgi:hypothetical protein